MSNNPATNPNQFGITPRAYHKKNPRWYHTHIIDWMMANPGGSLADCALFVGKTQPTLSAIIRSDLFQAALEKRKAEFSNVQDLIIKKKLTQVSIASLDMILDVIDKKKSTIPLESLNEVADGALKRLGYGLETKQSPVQVNIQNNSVAVPVSAAELDSARTLMKQHQNKIAGGDVLGNHAPKTIEADVVTIQEDALPPGPVAAVPDKDGE